MKVCFCGFLLLAAALGQFRFATPGYHFQFPRDYFNHPDYQTEWWYYSGNLTAHGGREFGFEVAFFRLGVSSPGARKSVWQVNNIYMAHAALSDLEGKHFLYDERVNRAGPGIAGVSEREERVWNANWQVQWQSAIQQLQAVTESFSIRLTFKPAKPLVLNGHNGLTPKTSGPGNASEYFSFTRLQTTGNIVMRGHGYQVTGSSWMDHEFSTTPKDSPLAGWDWLSIQLNNDTEIMLYRIRMKDGDISPDSSGTYTDARGHGHYLGIHDFTLIPGQTWTSAHSHGRYPIEWRVAIPSLQLSLQITTPLKDQELVSNSSVSPTYWEGAIRIKGEEAGKPIKGIGYLEMTGYSKPLGSGRT
jgi:predicted secreted hydrolase